MDVLLIGSGVLPIPPPGWGAVEKAIDGLARGLRESGIHVEVLNRTYSQHPRDEYRFALEVPDLLRERSYDVAHASTPVVGNALLLRGFSYVYTSHSRHWWGARSPTERLGFHLEKRACAGARRVIALSSAVAERMSRVRPPTPSRNVRVIPNGVDTELFRPDWSSRTGRRILGVGAIHPRKRWHLAARVVREIPQAELVLVGPVQDPKYARDLERWIGAPGRLTLTGEIPEADLALQFARADVYFHPSGSELLSLAALEALSSALPVLGSDVLSPQAPVPEAGFLVPEPLDEGEKIRLWREHLESILRDEPSRRAMGQAGRWHALENYSWPRVAQQVVEVYRETIAQSPSKPRLPPGSRPVLW